MALIKTCGTCALRQNGICPIFQEAVEAAQSACVKYTDTIYNCELCGNIVLHGDRLFDITIPNEIHTVCRSCKKQFGRCPTCKCGNECRFETEPSDLPKLIQKEFRQGNMIQIVTVKNPSLVDLTCKNGCPCFDPDFGCLKENNTCGNYKIVYEGR